MATLMFDGRQVPSVSRDQSGSAGDGTSTPT
ncbi:MAG: hypothetical protein ACI8XD_001441 [Thermoproteota archaeon]|jgi:hypothetical protein